MQEYPLVRDCMDTSFVKLNPSMDVYHAIETLLNNRITGAAVVDDDDNLVGILSERDCLKTLLHGAYNNMPLAQVGDYMTTEVETIPPTWDVVAAADFFHQHVYRRLLVVEDGKLVGQITRRDLLRAIQAIMKKQRSGA